MMTTNNVLKNAEMRRAHLLGEVARLDDFLRLYQELDRCSASFSDATADMPDMVDHPTSLAAKEPPVASTPADGRKVSRADPLQERWKPKDIVKEALAVITEAGRPLSRTEVTDRLNLRGAVPAGKSQIRYVGTLLWRHNDKVINLDGYGLWRRDLPYEPARYVPVAGERRHGRQLDIHDRN